MGVGEPHCEFSTCSLTLNVILELGLRHLQAVRVSERGGQGSGQSGGTEQGPQTLPRPPCSPMALAAGRGVDGSIPTSSQPGLVLGFAVSRGQPTA